MLVKCRGINMVGEKWPKTVVSYIVASILYYAELVHFILVGMVTFY